MSAQYQLGRIYAKGEIVPRNDAARRRMADEGGAAGAPRSAQGGGRAPLRHGQRHRGRRARSRRRRAAALRQAQGRRPARRGCRAAPLPRRRAPSASRRRRNGPRASTATPATTRPAPSPSAWAASPTCRAPPSTPPRRTPGTSSAGSRRPTASALTSLRAGEARAVRFRISGDEYREQALKLLPWICTRCARDPRLAKTKEFIASRDDPPLPSLIEWYQPMPLTVDLQVLPLGGHRLHRRLRRGGTQPRVVQRDARNPLPRACALLEDRAVATVVHHHFWRAVCVEVDHQHAARRERPPRRTSGRRCSSRP